MKVTLLLSMMTLLAVALTATAGEVTGEQKPIKASFEGKLVCAGCDLKEAEGARAACSVYGHHHVLKKADGTYISFLENDYSKDLIAGEKYHNKDISVSGIYYANANLLDVETFTVDDQKKGWCGHCKAMDGCPFKGKM
jgi:hypothetical protein